MKNNEILEDMERETLSTWVKTMLTIYPTLPNIIKVIDSIVELRATNLTQHTLQVVSLNIQVMTKSIVL